jgi:hypothetical protein
MLSLLQVILIVAVTSIIVTTAHYYLPLSDDATVALLLKHINAEDRALKSGGPPLGAVGEMLDTVLVSHPEAVTPHLMDDARQSGWILAMDKRQIPEDLEERDFSRLL